MGCAEAGFSGCCSGSCRLGQANCGCDEDCYRRRDCCEDIQQTCPRGENTDTVFSIVIIDIMYDLVANYAYFQEVYYIVIFEIC